MGSVTEFQDVRRGGLRGWKFLLASDDASPHVTIPAEADRTVQVFGTFAGTTVTVEGSCEETPTTWFTLHDGGGNELSFTAAGGDILIEDCLHVRVATTGGDVAGTTAVEVHLNARRTR